MNIKHSSLPTVIAPLALFLVSGSSAQAAKLVVPSGSFPTIQSAVNASSQNDEIIVLKGVYESFMIAGKTDLTISGKKGAVIRPSAGEGIRIENSSRIEVRRLVVKDPPASAMFALNCSDIIFSKCTTTRAGDHGVLLINTPRTEIRSNKIVDSDKNGISIAGDGPILIEDNLIKTSGEAGIATGSNEMTIENNVIEESMLSGILCVAGGSPSVVLVQTNRIDRAGLAGGVGDDGVRVSGYDGAYLIKNVVTRAVKNAIRVDFGNTEVALIENMVIEPGENGLHATSSTIIIDNTVKKAGLDAFHLAVGTDDSYLKGNVSKKAGEDGVQIDSNDVTLLKNKATKSTAFDLVDAGTGTQLMQNTFPNISP